ncbi:G protein-activated inward rectifier potassium channel 3 isoform X4 [Tribolium castaneum]|uniref:G protein-activated inward rectifier potassium channel 3 isoform X4 n=1 Tax=Tribolium castaneum TaxID=7070 RepID=UPI00046C0787|nr:PREDICTED: G protein-activated inward rectifier potassium channel 3 isoform X5 [Tribolium castaneum]|eukprot:XP_008197288.1 PREDICTED: G protein-activated inward rectifier potassium channel 3 isoform X5 [Tribolium castaneum]
MTNNQVMLDEVRIENESKVQSEQLEKLLGNSSVPSVVPAQLPVPLADRRKSESSLLGSFSRIRLSIGNNSKDAPNGHVFSRYKQSRFNARRIRKRVVFKHGDCNVVQANVAKRRRKYLQDIFTTLVDAQWRWTLLVFAFNFLGSWLVFAVVWWLIAYTHGDLLEEHLNGTEPWTPCITNIYGFTSCFLFSVETQHTIGYGGRTTTEECPEAIFVMCLQSIGGVMIQAFMVGVVFAKLSRPKKRTQTLLFSRNAVISHRDGVPCLMFRVGDMRKSHIIEAHVRAQLIKHKVTKEGENLPFFQTELKVWVGGDGEEDKIFFIWPTMIVHKIDKNSPLYNMSATDLLRERFEIVVILEGVIESTGMTTQARSSYLPSEILWGHRFQSLINFKKDSGQYEVDYALFNNTVEVDTPLCSAKQLDEYRHMSSTECVGLLADHLRTGLFPSMRTHSSDTLSSMDSLSTDEHIVMKVPEHIAMKVPSPIPVTVTAPEEATPLRNGSVPKATLPVPV